jgi:MFS transporter, DHA2 family, multidrug resistance protein
VAALFVLSLAVFMVAIDGTVLSVAVPAITEQLSPGYNQVLWIGDIYSFVLAGLLVTMGNLGDRIGRKRLLMVASLGFGVASAAAAFAATSELLIVLRAVQGLAGAGLMPPTLALLRTVFTDDRLRMRAVGIWSASGAAGAAMGPVLAGVLLEHYFWGSVLLVNLPVVALIVGLGYRVLPEARSEGDHPLDPVSVAISTAGILGMVYGVTELAHSGPGFWPAYPALVVGAVLVWTFVRRQRGLSSPLLDLALFAQPRFGAAIVSQLAIVFANVGALFFLPIFLRQVVGFSPLQSGVALLPAALASLVTAPNTGRLIRAWGHRRVLLVGLSAGAAGLAGLGLALPASFGAMVIPLVLLGFSFGSVVTCGSDLVLTSASADRVGAATGISETAFELGNALGIALTGSAVSVLYLAVTGLPARLSEAADPGGFTAGLAGACVAGALVLSVVVAVVARTVREERRALW